MTVCDGNCGREATGPFDSGQPALDAQHTWCDRCRATLAAGRMPPGLAVYGPYDPPRLPCAAVN